MYCLCMYTTGLFPNFRQCGTIHPESKKGGHTAKARRKPAAAAYLIMKAFINVSLYSYELLESSLREESGSNSYAYNKGTVKDTA